jgi:hypothetical protein
MLAKSLQQAAFNGVSTGEVAEAIDFGNPPGIATDYLTRSEFTGDADGKTLTFSAWFWKAADGTAVNFYSTDQAGNVGFAVGINASNQLSVEARNISNTVILSAVVTSPLLGATNTFQHVLVSLDMSNTANRSVYINDALATVTWTTYDNQNIDFTKTRESAATRGGGGDSFNGRLAHLYLDYTYRALGTEANRRLFITADRKPTPKASLAALNPILYLPLDDPTQPGLNLGTGGNFNLTGVVARSGRGPNQYNTPYANLDGTTLYRAQSLAGILNGKAATLSLWTTANDTGSDGIFSIGSSNLRFVLEKSFTVFTLSARSSAGTTVLTATWPMVAVGRNAHVIASFDLTNASNRHVFVNGVSQSVTWSTYLNTDVEFSRAEVLVWDKNGSAPTPYNGKIGDLWFHTSYIDLSVPANLAKFVTGTGIDAKPVDLGANGEGPTGLSPLLYLPMYANHVNRNLGTGGVFAAVTNPAPTGARGPSEFWGNRADFNGTTGYLARTSALSGVSNGKTFSCSFWVQPDASAVAHTYLNILDASWRFVVYRDSSNRLAVAGKNAAGTTILSGTTTALIGTTPVFVQICVDLSDTGKRHIYGDGVAASVTWGTYVNDEILWSHPNVQIGNTSSFGGLLDGKLSELYFTTQYIDFSQEANRLLFRDAFGNPTNLPALIAAGTVPNPAIYMRFNPASWGTNSGTGGDFTVNGSISDGGQL